MRAFIVVLSVALVVLVAALVSAGSGGDEQRSGEASSVGAQTDLDGPVVVDPADVPDPVSDGAALPPSFRQLLPRDGIPPIYDPAFVAATDSGWSDDTLVIGLAIDGEAKAYSVPDLNRREMVIDRLAGIPVLVTW